MKPFMLATALAVSGCGHTLQSSPFQVPDELQSSVAYFLDECKVAGLHCEVEGLSVQYTTTLPSGIVGLCTIDWYGGRMVRRVQILKGEYSREQLDLVVAHEMAHCTLFLGHISDATPHLMRSQMLSDVETQLKTTSQWIREGITTTPRMGGL
jgi:hypothetical protein